MARNQYPKQPVSITYRPAPSQTITNSNQSSVLPCLLPKNKTCEAPTNLQTREALCAQDPTLTSLAATVLPVTNHPSRADCTYHHHRRDISAQTTASSIAPASAAVNSSHRRSP
jgi:hypothetical protein